jgi:hypothetical protein
MPTMTQAASMSSSEALPEHGHSSFNSKSSTMTNSML